MGGKRKKNFSRDKLEYTVTVGKHTVTGKAENPKIAKNKAAGELLKKLHSNCIPSVNKWGDLLRLYSTKPTETQLKAEQHEKDILALKGVNRTRTKEPNHELLGKLRFLMKEIHGKREMDQKLNAQNLNAQNFNGSHLNGSQSQFNQSNGELFHSTPLISKVPQAKSLLNNPQNSPKLSSVKSSSSTQSSNPMKPNNPQNYVHTYFNHSIPAEAVIQPSPMPGERIVTKLPILDL